MDINEYISSGVLELYVAGALDPGQMREVEEMAARHPEVRREIAAIEETVAAMMRTDRGPRPELRSQIIGRIATLGEGSPQPASAPPPLPARSPVSPAIRYMLAAAIAVAIVSSGLAIYYWVQLQRTRMELVNAREQQQKTSNEVNVYKARYAEARSELGVLRSPGNRVVELHGTAKAPSASRTATVAASAATSISGGRARAATAIPAAIPTSPSQRLRLCQIASHSPPSAISASAATGMEAAGVTAPGNPDTARPSASIRSMPRPSQCSGSASSPNGIAATDSVASGITTNPITGIASRLPRTA